MKTNKLTISERIELYTQAVRTLKRLFRQGTPKGWCYVLYYSKLNGRDLGMTYNIYTTSVFKEVFPDLLKYAKKTLDQAYNEVGGDGYLFPLDSRGNDHRIRVLEYRINQLKEQLNK